MVVGVLLWWWCTQQQNNNNNTQHTAHYWRGSSTRYLFKGKGKKGLVSNTSLRPSNPSSIIHHPSSTHPTYLPTHPHSYHSTYCTLPSHTHQHGTAPGSTGLNSVRAPRRVERLKGRIFLDFSRFLPQQNWMEGGGCGVEKKRGSRRPRPGSSIVQ